MARSPIAKHEAFGVAEVASKIITLPNRHSKGGVPVVTLYFPDSQKPAGALNKQTGVSIAFLQIVGWREAEDLRKMFSSEMSAPSRGAPRHNPDEKRREANVASARAGAEFGLKHR